MTATSDVIARNFAADIRDRVEHLAAIWYEEAPHNDYREMAGRIRRLMPTRGIWYRRLLTQPFGFVFKIGRDPNLYQITVDDTYAVGLAAAEGVSA